MKKRKNDSSFVFLIGSPRSGTTLLGEILDKHKEISQWYEPYFIWDHFFRHYADDVRSAEDATQKVQRQIRSAFIRYQKKAGNKIIIDKSPRNSLKIPFIRKIFPEAKFIHICRDGRDVTLSIHREWLHRKNIINNQDKINGFDYPGAFTVIKQWLDRQPFIMDRLRALWFETHGHLFDKSQHLNRKRWYGDVGWGPKFKGWEDVLKERSLLQFNAYQWRECLESILKYWSEIDKQQGLLIKYEDLITNGEETIKVILNFLGLKFYEGYSLSFPEIKKDNFNKWQKGFSREKIEDIHDILTPALIKLGYEKNEAW